MERLSRVWLVIGLISGALAIWGVFLPWVDVAFGIPISGWAIAKLGGPIYSYLALGGCILIAICALGGLAYPRVRGLASGLVIGAAVVSVAGAWASIDIYNQAPFASVAGGLGVTMLFGALGGLLSGLGAMGELRRRRKR